MSTSPLPQDLVDRFLAHDQDAATDLFSLVRHGLVRSLQGRGLSREDAEEVVNDAFLKLWSLHGSLAAEHFIRLARLTCKHLGIDRFRKNGRRVDTVSVPEEILADSSTPESEALSREAVDVEEEFRAAVKELVHEYDRQLFLGSVPARLRSAMSDMLTRHDEEPSELASNPSTARSRKYRALRRYRALLTSLPAPQVHLSSDLSRRLTERDATGRPLSSVKVLLFHLPADQQAVLAEILLGTRIEELAEDPRVETMLATLTDLAERAENPRLTASVNDLRRRLKTRTAQPAIHRVPRAIANQDSAVDSCV